jgi:hypothetical protein
VAAAVVEHRLAAEVAEFREGGANPRLVIEVAFVVESQVDVAVGERDGAVGRLAVVEDDLGRATIHVGTGLSVRGSVV